MEEKRIGVDLGGTRVKMGLVQAGRVTREEIYPTPVQEGYEAVLDVIAGGVRALMEDAPGIGIVGMGVPGILDCGRGMVCYSNNFGWQDKAFVEDMQKRLGLEVRIANDAQCATLGEALYGAGKGYGRVAMFTIGTGVGGGFVKGGRLETDAYGTMAYIFGHEVVEVGGNACNCGRKGCLEAYASAPVLEKAGKDLLGPGHGAKELFEKARQGDDAALEALEGFLDHLSAGVVNIANILRPEVIVVGGGVSASADQILPRLNEALRKEVYGYEYAPVAAVCAALGNRAGIVGASSL